MSQFRVLDLFSGIGGFSLGLERAGMETVAFCEQDGYARRVLRKHWPEVWLYDDVRTLTAKRLKQDGLTPNVICGGFPCQDISTAGKGAGIDGARSGLWSEMLRLVREIKPVWVIAENVPALRGRGADRVLADLEGAGYAAWPTVVGAVHVGASHRRDRVWIVAHPFGRGFHASDQQRNKSIEARIADSIGACSRIDSDAHGKRWSDRGIFPVQPPESGPQSRIQERGKWRLWPGPRVCRIADGIPNRVDRLRCLGNAVVPLIPELIGRAILEHSETTP